MNDWHVLVIEDETDSADVVSRILKYHQIAHTVAASAEEALPLVAQIKPTLLIVDLALPGMDGWQFLKRVRSNPATETIPAVAITAFHSAHVAEQAREQGFDGYFPKPIEPMSFAESLRVIVEASSRR